MSRRGEKTRARILEAAQAAVLDRGFSATSVDDVQKAAGISRGTFFYHFPTKAAVSKAILAEHAKTDAAITDQIRDEAEQLVNDPGQQLVVMIGLLEKLFDQMDTEYSGCLFASYAYEAGLFDEETHLLVQNAIDHWRAVIEAKVVEAIDVRPPRIPITPREAADQTWLVLQGAFIMAKVEHSNQLIVDQLRLLKNQYELIFCSATG